MPSFVYFMLVLGKFPANNFKFPSKKVIFIKFFGALNLHTPKPNPAIEFLAVPSENSDWKSRSQIQNEIFRVEVRVNICNYNLLEKAEATKRCLVTLIKWCQTTVSTWKLVQLSSLRWTFPESIFFFGFHGTNKIHALSIKRCVCVKVS